MNNFNLSLFEEFRKKAMNSISPFQREPPSADRALASF